MAAHRKKRILVWSLAALAAAVALAGGWCLEKRFVEHNFGVVVPGQVYRSAQPDGKLIERWVGAYGLRTVLNLRGDDKTNSDVKDVIRTTRRLGVKYLSRQWPETTLPKGAALRQVIVDIETSPRPILIHCRAGADRTGVVSVLAAMAVGGMTYDQARPQLTIRHLHFDDGPNHVSALLQRYEQYCRQRGISTGDWRQFRQWAMEVYDVTPSPKSLPAGGD